MKPDLFYESTSSTNVDNHATNDTIAKTGKGKAKPKKEEKQTNEMGLAFMNNPFRNLNAVYTLSSLTELLLDYRPTGNEKRQLKRALENHDYALIKDMIDTIRSRDYLHL